MPFLKKTCQRIAVGSLGQPHRRTSSFSPRHAGSFLNSSQFVPDAGPKTAGVTTQDLDKPFYGEVLGTLRFQDYAIKAAAIQDIRIGVSDRNGPISRRYPNS